MAGPSSATRPISILVCDDEVRVRALLERVLRDEGYRVETVSDGQAAIALLRSGAEYDLVITDMRMPRAGGFAVLEAARAAPSAPVVVAVTGYASIDETVLAIRSGAADYLAKPFHVDRLLEVVANVTKGRREGAPVPVAPPPPPADDGSSRCGLVGESEVMRGVYARVLRLAPLEATVLIQGEAGAGKEVAAAALHELSSRKRGPFVRASCATTDRALLEKALFGSEQGPAGFFQAARGGTLFLDAVGEVPLELQAKLLHAIEKKEVLRAGGTRTEPVDVRVVAATDRDLDAAARRGRFRDDLYLHLSAFVLALPPLRERRGDIPLLVRSHLPRFARELRKEVPALTLEALGRLVTYDWPGNVSELETTLRALVACAGGPLIDVHDLPPRIAALAPSLEGSRSGDSPPGVELGYHAAKNRVIEQFERSYFKALVAATGDNLSAAARKAGLDRKSLREKLRRLGIKMRAEPSTEGDASAEAEGGRAEEGLPDPDETRDLKAWREREEA
jgi:DNA-binding NtrC family response regulator